MSKNFAGVFAFILKKVIDNLEFKKEKQSDISLFGCKLVCVMSSNSMHMCMHVHICMKKYNHHLQR